MTHRSNVVQRREPLTEEQFRNTWLTTLGRLCRLHGDSQVAHWLGVSERHLRNIKSGASMPTADKIWNLLAYDDSAHDELDGEFGHKNVPKDAVCTADPLTLDMIALAHETARDEADDSPGGPSVTDGELRQKDEARLRKVHRVLTHWLDRIERINRPTIRAVGGR